MAALQALDIPYTSAASHSLLRFDLHCVRGGDVQPGAGTLVFIHGGAWRTEDKADHAGLARRLAAATRWPVLVPNYRLTQPTRGTTGQHMFRHPGHAKDILDFLQFLGGWEPPSELNLKCDLASIFVIGHSCAAHMLSSIFLDSDHATPSLAPPAQLLEAVKGIVMSEGIYNIDRLVGTFPSYRDWFIEDAFGPGEDYASYDVTRYQLRPLGGKASWLILHSRADSLVDITQSKIMCDHLYELHEDRPENVIFHDFDRLKDGHDEILHGDEYVALVQEFVSRVHPLP